ncbi:hypothetical protein [Photobacterium kagoshimensis]|uniref:hypothetical protein n=1 Tax=Photobacterium kagoshimensis TaxID=2910242 RepID=UPI003D0B61DE
MIYDVSKILGVEPVGDLEKAAESINKAEKRFLDLKPKVEKHVGIMCFIYDRNQNPIYKSILDPERESPTGSDVKKVVDSLSMSKAEIARVLGVSPKGNTTLNRWINSGSEKSTIPYAAWRLLCAYAGFSIDLRLERNK